MSKAPRYDFTLGSKTLDQLGIIHLIKSITFTEEIGKFDQVEMVIKDGPELETAYYLIKHGNVLQLSMGYHNDVIMPMTICFMKGLKPNFKTREVTIKFAGYLKAFDCGEKNRVLSNRTIQEVVTEIVADYDPIVVGTIDNGDTLISDTTSQSKESDLKVLESIASMFGMRWKMEATDTPGVWALSLYKLGFGDGADKGALPIYAYPHKTELSPNVALHLADFQPESNILGVSSTVQIRSNNPNHPIEVESQTENFDRHSTGVRGSEIVATVFGTVTRIQFMENVTNEDAAQIIADQLLQEDELSFVVAKNNQLNEGNPFIRVGKVRHVVPRGISLFETLFEGDYIITKTKHVISTDKGYDTWFDCAMDNLKVPPPPSSTGSGGGGGIPVLIHVFRDGFMEGWYMSFDANGTAIKGTHITHDEILANDYWLGFVNTEAWVVRHGSGYVDIYQSVNADPWQELTLSMVGSFATNQSDIAPGGAYSSVYIDWPSQWNSGVLASSVQETSIYSAEEIEEALSVIPGLGPEEEVVETRDDGITWLEWARWQATRGAFYRDVGGDGGL